MFNIHPYATALAKEKAVTKEWGMGGDSSRALNAVTTAITGALGGQTDLQTASNALVPYASQLIGQTLSTYKLGQDNSTNKQGGRFDACTHYSGILPEEVNIPTGRK